MDKYLPHSLQLQFAHFLKIKKIKIFINYELAKKILQENLGLTYLIQFQRLLINI